VVGFAGNIVLVSLSDIAADHRLRIVRLLPGMSPGAPPPPLAGGSAGLPGGLAVGGRDR